MSTLFAVESLFTNSYTWTLVNDATTFSPRDGAGALVFDDKMWLLGGWNPYIFTEATTSEVWFSTNGYTWTLATVAPWEGRHCAGYVVYDNKMWIVGGDNNRYHYQNDVWYSSDGISWTLATDDVPWRNRGTHYVLVYDNKIWVLGGQQIEQFGGGTEVYNDVWYSTNGITWTLATEHAPWSPRGQIMGSAVFDGKMWVIGGGTYNNPRQYYNDIWYSTNGITWTLVSANAPWQPRQYHNLIVFDNKMWVLGGYNKNNLNDVWYSSDGVNWHKLFGTPWLPRHAGSVFVYNDSLWMVSGSSHAGPTNDVWKLSSLDHPISVDLVSFSQQTTLSSRSVQILSLLIVVVIGSWLGKRILHFSTSVTS